MFCRQTVELWGGVRQRFTCKVGCCSLIVVDLICFRSTKYSSQDDKKNFWSCKTPKNNSGLKQVCCFWARNITENWEEKKRWAERADKKHVNNLTFGKTVCFNGCQTSNVWWQNTSCLAPNFRLCSRLDATKGNASSVMCKLYFSLLTHHDQKIGLYP